MLMGLVFEMCQFPKTKVQGEKKTDGSMSHNRKSCMVSHLSGETEK